MCFEIIQKYYKGWFCETTEESPSHDYQLFSEPIVVQPSSPPNNERQPIIFASDEYWKLFDENMKQTDILSNRLCNTSM